MAHARVRQPAIAWIPAVLSNEQWKGTNAPFWSPGGTGYIGSHTVLVLIEAGETVVVLDNLSTGFEAAVSPAAKLIVGDIGDPTLVENAITGHKIDAIIHFAGSVVVSESVANPLRYYHNNTCKARTLMEAAVKGRVPHFIFSSTAAVYGAGGLEPVKENNPPRAQSPYGRSKLMSEWMLEDISKAHGLNCTVVRYFNVARRSTRANRPSNQRCDSFDKSCERSGLGQAKVCGGVRYRLSHT